MSHTRRGGTSVLPRSKLDNGDRMWSAPCLEQNLCTGETAKRKTPSGRRIATGEGPVSRIIQITWPSRHRFQPILRIIKFLTYIVGTHRLLEHENDEYAAQEDNSIGIHICLSGVRVMFSHDQVPIPRAVKLQKPRKHHTISLFPSFTCRLPRLAPVTLLSSLE